ncbi:MAG: substrate-binding domain-containing protein, partial [Anaerolineae bacterium]|nr:substrate-binding domain-containing protein [Anaerolineae bacterium]
MMRRPVLGVITNDQTGVFQRAIIDGIRQIADLHSYDVLVEALGAGSSSYLEPTQLAGVMVISNAIPDSQILGFQQAGLPVSLISHHLPNTLIPSVITDNRQGMQCLMEHIVVGCGRRRVVFVRGLDHQSDAQERLAAFRDEAMRYTLDVPEAFVLRGEFAPSVAAQSVRALLAERRDFDAVIAADYLMGVAVLDALSEAGVRVPEDVCVAGYGDGEEARRRYLTVVAADVVEQGRRSARQLMGQMRGLTMRGVTVLNADLIPRA